MGVIKYNFSTEKYFAKLCITVKDVNILSLNLLHHHSPEETRWIASETS